MPAIYLTVRKGYSCRDSCESAGGDFPGVPDGVYSLEAISAKSLYEKLTMENVTVLEGETLEVEMELLDQIMLV